jgi:hypothetical protein
MQVMLSAPRPSLAARFIGHIFSIINSIMRDKTTCPLLLPPEAAAAAPTLPVVADDVVFLESADDDPAAPPPIGTEAFFAGEGAPLRPAIVVYFAIFKDGPRLEAEVEEVDVLEVIGNFFSNLFFVSYTKSTAYWLVKQSHIPSHAMIAKSCSGFNCSTIISGTEVTMLSSGLN